MILTMKGYFKHEKTRYLLPIEDMTVWYTTYTSYCEIRCTRK